MQWTSRPASRASHLLGCPQARQLGADPVGKSLLHLPSATPRSAAPHGTCTIALLHARRRTSNTSFVVDSSICSSSHSTSSGMLATSHRLELRPPEVGNTCNASSALKVAWLRCNLRQTLAKYNANTKQDAEQGKRSRLCSALWCELQAHPDLAALQFRWQVLAADVIHQCDHREGHLGCHCAYRVDRQHKHHHAGRADVLPANTLARWLHRGDLATRTLLSRLAAPFKCSAEQVQSTVYTPVQRRVAIYVHIWLLVLALALAKLLVEFRGLCSATEHTL